MKSVLFVVLILALSACECQSCSSDECKNILFIGNSFTYENDGINEHLENLICGSKDLNVNVHMAAEGKYHLMTHWEDSETQDLFTSKKWDKIILQEYVLGPLKKPAEFEKYVKIWADQTRASHPNSEVYLFSPWRYKSANGMENRLFAKCTSVAENMDAEVVPVGLLWEKLRSKVDLYFEDGAHPNRKGTFVTACLFYEQLLDRDVTKTQHTDPEISKAEQKRLKKWVHEFNLSLHE